MGKKRYTGIAVFLISVMMSVCLLTSCFGKKVLFSCNADNAAGFSGVDFRNGVITLYFDKEKAPSGEMKRLFYDTEKNIRVSVSGKYGTEEYGPANITTDNEQMKVMISTGMNSANDIVGILLFCDRDQLSLNLLQSKLITRVAVSTEGSIGPFRGAFTTTYRITTQSYDKRSRSWSEPVQETSDMKIYQ